MVKLIKVALVLISLIFFGYTFYMIYSIVSNTILAPIALALSFATLASIRKTKCEKEEEAKINKIAENTAF